MARLLLIGLRTFADENGVQPLKPRRIRMQIFPDDAIDGDAVRAMIDDLAARAGPCGGRIITPEPVVEQLLKR